MTECEFAVDMLTRLPYEPNGQQMQVALALAHFCCVTGKNDVGGTVDRVFILNGYAGTGKTSLISALVKTLRANRKGVVLLAPTGRAAKVFNRYSGVQASTIHRHIYRNSLSGIGGPPQPKENTDKNTVFIVDEASMIGTDSELGSNLLSDLVQYVYSGEGCRMILLGDTAQLPPVGQTESPAMSSDSLRLYGLRVTRATLTEVARQGAESGILRNATRLRRAMSLPVEKIGSIVPLSLNGYDDVRSVAGEELPDLLDSLYRNDGAEETIIITRSNRTATQYNIAVRTQILGYEEELVPGDLFIAAKNNYYWTRSVKGLDFIANGESLRLVKVMGTEVCYGLRFADVMMEIADRPGIEFAVKIVLNTLTGDSAALDRTSMQQMYEGIAADSPDGIPPSVSRLCESPYWNALQVKYAYAVTCHKAQGGQWKNVLVDLSYVPPDQIGYEFYRWLYTAVTRAYGRLYLINPPEECVD